MSDNQNHETSKSGSDASPEISQAVDSSTPVTVTPNGAQKTGSSSLVPAAMTPVVVKPRANKAGWAFGEKAQVTPDEAVKRLALAATTQAGVSTVNKPDFASNTVAGAPSITELAYALKNDPQLIYQFVHDNIEWEPGYGSDRGALGCLLDGMGNACDQSSLMIALLTAAAVNNPAITNPAWVFGSIQLTTAQYNNWFNTSSLTAAAAYLDQANIPESLVSNGQMNHVWVQVEISGTTYVFDPSFKTYNRPATFVVGGATITAGDTLTATVTSAALTGGALPISYTVLSSDNLASIAAGLSAAINANSSLAAIGVTSFGSEGTLAPPQFTVTALPASATSFSASVSSGATETLTMVSPSANLQTIMGYPGTGSSNFLTEAETGANYATDGTYVSNMNRTAVRSNLLSYTDNLKSWIEASYPTASLDQILGGQAIVPVTLPVSNMSSLPYQAGSPTVQTAIPNSFRTILTIQWPSPAQTMWAPYTDTLAGTRLTMSFIVGTCGGTSGNVQAQLYSNGVAVGTPGPCVPTATSGTAYSINLFIQHTYDSSPQGPFAGGDLYTNGTYFIGFTAGNIGSGQLDFHTNALAANVAAGGTPSSEPVLGEQLAELFFNYTSASSKKNDLIGRITGCKSAVDQMIGMTGVVYTRSGEGQYYFINMLSIALFSTNLSSGTKTNPSNDYTTATLGSALEGVSCAQFVGQTVGTCTVAVIEAANRSAVATINVASGGPTNNDVVTINVLDPALSGGSLPISHTVGTGDTAFSIATYLAEGINTNATLEALGVTAQSALVGGDPDASSALVLILSGSPNQTSYSGSVTPVTPPALESVTIGFQKIFAATNSNWTSGYGTAGVYGILSADGYSSTVLNSIGTSVSLGPVLVSTNPLTTLKEWTGSAYEAINPTLYLAEINGVWYGGGSTTTGSYYYRATQQKAPIIVIGDPVDPVSGAFLYTKTDISVGSQAFPYGLDFTRNYSSQQRYVNGPLGLGWTHNHAMSATANSDSLLAMGRDFALQAVASIVTMVVTADLYSDTTLPVAKLTAATIVDAWWSDQLVNNTVVLSGPAGASVCLKQPDGTYTMPYDYPGTLTLTSGQYTLTTPLGVKQVYNTSGQISTIVYPNGVTVTYSYNGSGQLYSISNGMGRTLTLNYTGSNLTSVTDGTGRTASYVYDTNSDLVQMVDPLLQTYNFSYGATGAVTPGMLTQIFKPLSTTTAIVTNVYDTLGRIKTQANARNQVTSCYFAGSRTEQIDPVGDVTTWYFNTAGYTTRFIDALGNETDYVYDSFNRVLKMTLPEGNSTQYTYDGNNNVLTMTANPKPGSGLSSITNTYTYNTTWAKVATFTDGLLQTTTWNYDAYGNISSVVKPAAGTGQSQPTTSFTYNGRGQVLTGTDPTGVVTQFTYDTVTEELDSIVVDPGSSPHLALTTSFLYDAVGNVTSVTNPNGNATTMVFDGLRRQTQITSPSPFSYVTNFAYDSNSNLLSTQRQTGTTPAWQAYSYTYSPTDKVLTTTDPAGNTTTLTYETATNGKDRLIASTDAQGRQYQFAYDGLDRVNQVTNPMSVISVAKTFTNNGMLATISDASSNQTQYSYDGFDRPNKTTYPDGSFAENVSYDNNGNVLTAQTRSGGTFTNTYDFLNRLATKNMSGQATATYGVTYGYDLAGRLTGLEKGTSGTSSTDPSLGSLVFSFDTAGRFYKETYPDGSAVTHVLDANGNKTQTTWPDAYYINRTFDQMDRLTGIKLNGASAYALQFSYNELSQRTGITYGNGAAVVYTPQLNGDVTNISHQFVGAGANFAYAYDDVHELTSQQISDPGLVYHPSTAGGVAYTTSANFAKLNQYATVDGAAYTYNTNGCLVSDSTLTYAYDYGATPTENQLTSVSSGSTTLASFIYDPMHRQVLKTTGSSNTRYIYSGWQRIADYNESTGLVENRYIYGTGLDEPLIQVSGSTVTYYHQDRMGSVVAVTNSFGAVINRNAFGPFGETPALGGTSFGFTGQRFDPETGLYYYKNRYYSPSTGRFLQPDPIGYGGGDLNIYAYVNNAPHVATDPMGLQPSAPAAQTGPGLGSLLSPGGSGNAAPSVPYIPTIFRTEKNSGHKGTPPATGPGSGPGVGDGAGGGTPKGQVDPLLKLLGSLYPWLNAATIASIAYLSVFLATLAEAAAGAYVIEQIARQYALQLGAAAAGAGNLIASGGFLPANGTLSGEVLGLAQELTLEGTITIEGSTLMVNISHLQIDASLGITVIPKLIAYLNQTALSVGATTIQLEAIGVVNPTLQNQLIRAGAFFTGISATGGNNWIITSTVR